MVKLTLQHHELTVKAVKQIYMDCQSEEDKYRVVVDLYHTMTVGASIIFVRVHLHRNFYCRDKFPAD
jgi:ATP-dependent RNA helicase DDX19/DBP5